MYCTYQESIINKYMYVPEEKSLNIYSKRKMNRGICRKRRLNRCAHVEVKTEHSWLATSVLIKLTVDNGCYVIWVFYVCFKC